MRKRPDIAENDRYRFHRYALAPLIGDDAQGELNAVRQGIQEAELGRFLGFLLENGLGPLWHEVLNRVGAAELFPIQFLDKLKNARMHAATGYVQQKHALKQIQAIFDAETIPYAVFKGVHVRELLYQDPAARYACDIDVLVSKEDRMRAIKKLVQAGFLYHPVPIHVSHEGYLTYGNVSLDLHWDIMRPGRTRVDLAEVFLETRLEFQGVSVLSAEAATFILLVHPVFTKYSTTPQASLIRMVDLVRWVRTQKIDWERVLDYLERGGLKTAAWITATWLEMLTGVSLPQAFVEAIRPSPAKSRYLKWWIGGNLSTRLSEHRMLIHGGFTLLAHDTFGDALRATRRYREAKKSAEAEIREILEELGTEKN